MITSYARHGGQHVASVPANLMDGFPTAVAEALRSGVGLDILDGLMALREGERLVVTDSTANERTRIMSERGRAFQMRSNYDENAGLAKQAEDKERWRKLSEEQSAAIRRLETELAELEQKDDLPDSIYDTYETEIDLVLAAVDAIATHPVRLPRALAHSQEDLIPEPRIIITPAAELVAEVHMYLPASFGAPPRRGVVKVGPIRWMADDSPELAVGLVWAAREAAGEPAPWLSQPQPPRTRVQVTRALKASASHHRDVERVRAVGARKVILDHLYEADISEKARNLLMATPFPSAPFTLLAAVREEAPPSWVCPQWANDTWMQWQRALYTQVTAPPGHAYAVPSWSRQAVIDYTIDAGGRITFEELALKMMKHGVTLRALKKMVLDPQPGTRPWLLLSPVKRWGTWPTKGRRVPPTEFGVELATCPVCDAHIVTAVRAFDLPGDSLCPNGHLPNARAALEAIGVDLAQFPAVEQVVAPDCFQWLRVPRAVYAKQRTNGPFRDQAQLESDVRYQLARSSRSVRIGPVMEDLTEDDLVEARTLYVEERLSIAEVAKRFDINPGTMARYLRGLGITRPRGTYKNGPRRGTERYFIDLEAEEVEEAVKLYVEQFLSVAEVAKRLNVGPRGLNNYLRREGLTRPRGRFPGKALPALDTPPPSSAVDLPTTVPVCSEQFDAMAAAD